MSPAQLSDHRPSVAYAEYASAAEALDSACPRNTAAAALDVILCKRAYGSVDELIRALGVSRATIKNWRSHAVEFDTSAIWRVAAFYACSSPPANPEDLDRAIVDGIDGHRELFDLLYDPSPHAALGWLLDNRRANFRRDLTA